jgi:hypothetical protein
MNDNSSLINNHYITISQNSFEQITEAKNDSTYQKLENYDNTFLTGFLYYHENLSLINDDLIETIRKYFSEKKEENNLKTINTVINTQTLFCSEIKMEYISNNQPLQEENFELKKLNEILEKEVNLLKSLILINNLNLNSENNMCKHNLNNINIINILVNHSNYFVDICDKQNIDSLVNNDIEYKKQETLHTLMIKINVRLIL